MSRKLIDLQGLAEFKAKCDETYSGGTPVFDATIEEEGSELVIGMEAADKNDILEKKYPVIGLRVADEDNEGEFQILYFSVDQYKEHDDALVYDLWIGDEDANMISKIQLAFIQDRDEVVVQAEETDFQLGSGEGASKKEIDISGNSDQWSSAQLEDVYTNQYDVVEVVSSTVSTIIYRVDDAASGSNMVIYWGFVLQQGLTMFVFAYDSNDGYSLNTQVVPFLPGIDPSTDIGKVVTVDAQGDYALEAPAGGKVYTHMITITRNKNDSSPYMFLSCQFCSSSNTQITSLDDLIHYLYNKIPSDVTNAGGGLVCGGYYRDTQASTDTYQVMCAFGTRQGSTDYVLRLKCLTIDNSAITTVNKNVLSTLANVNFYDYVIEL